MNANISMDDLLTSLAEYRAAIHFYKTEPTGQWDHLAVIALTSHAKRLEREIVKRGGSVE